MKYVSHSLSTGYLFVLRRFLWNYIKVEDWSHQEWVGGERVMWWVSFFKAYVAFNLIPKIIFTYCKQFKQYKELKTSLKSPPSQISIIQNISLTLFVYKSMCICIIYIHLYMYLLFLLLFFKCHHSWQSVHLSVSDIQFCFTFLMFAWLSKSYV